MIENHNRRFYGGAEGNDETMRRIPPTLQAANRVSHAAIESRAIIPDA
jgi:hypothetical protein